MYVYHCTHTHTHISNLGEILSAVWLLYWKRHLIYMLSLVKWPHIFLSLFFSLVTPVACGNSPGQGSKPHHHSNLHHCSEFRILNPQHQERSSPCGVALSSFLCWLLLDFDQIPPSQWENPGNEFTISSSVWDGGGGRWCSYLLSLLYFLHSIHHFLT